MTLRLVAITLFAATALPVTAQETTLLMSRSIVGGLAAPEIKVTIWAIAKKRLQPKECFDLLRQVRESMPDRQGTVEGCQEGISSEFAPIARAEPLENAHYIGYSDPRFSNVVSRLFAVYHHPSPKYTCQYLLDRFHKDHADAMCMAGK